MLIVLRELSPPQRPLCVVGRLKRKKKRARGARWEGGREKRGLCHIMCRLRVVPHFSSGIVERAKHERAKKSPHARKGDTFFSLPAACRLFSRGVIFTPAHVSLALLSLWKNGGLLVVYSNVRFSDNGGSRRRFNGF